MQRNFRTEFPWQTRDRWTMASRLWTTATDTDQPLVVVVHGLGEHSGRYQRFAERLLDLGHNVAVPDLRGHGLSQGGRGDTPRFQSLVDDIGDYLQALRDASLIRQSVLLVGHSMGGAIATKFAIQSPDQLSGLFLISPYYREAFQPKWWRLLAGQVFYYLYPSFSLNVGLNLEHLAKDPEVRRSIQQDELSHQRLSARWAMEALEIANRLPYLRQPLPIPTAVAHGEHDQVTHPAASRFFAEHQNQMRQENDQCPLVRFELIADGLHQIHNDSHTRDQVFRIFEDLRVRATRDGCLPAA